MRVGSNYAFNRYFNNQNDSIDAEYQLENASVEGVGSKTLILLLITLFTTMIFITLSLKTGIHMISYVIAGIFSFIVQIIICFSPKKAKTLAIPYAISEGLIIGILCGLLELVLPEMGLQIAGIAFLVTLSVFAGAILVYRRGYITVNHRFKGFMLSLTFGILIFSAIFSILSLISYFTMGINLYSMFYFSGLGLICSVVMCIIASLYVVTSLGIADQMIQSGASKEYEWYAAYAITLNVIYLFLEVLRLILIIVQRNNRK